MSAQSVGHGGPRRRDISDWVRLGLVGTVIALGVIAIVTFAVVMSVNTKYSFQTLRIDLARVHFPSAYRLVALRRAGTDCAHTCSITETWTWSGNSDLTLSAACSDVHHAMTGAYSDTEVNSPVAPGAVCDYYSFKSGPGFTKSSIEGIVRPDRTQSAGGVDVQLTASF